MKTPTLAGGPKAGDIAPAVLLRSRIVRELLHRRAVDSWVASRRPAFVCRGNICRSPFAGAFVRQRLADVACIDAGVTARPGESSPPEAVEVARDYGVDLSTHRARRLERADFDRIDSLYVFDARNWFDLVRMFPSIARRVHLVGSLSSDLGSPIVEDPYGGDSDAYDATYSHLTRILTDAIEKRGARTSSG